MYCWLPHTPRPLSPRQRQIVQLRAQGLTHTQIARRLGVTVATVALASAHAARRLRLMSERERMLEIWLE